MSGPPPSALWSMNSAAPRPRSMRCRFFSRRGRTLRHPPLHRGRSRGRARSGGSPRSNVAFGEPGYPPATRPGGCAAAAALRQRQARARQYSHRRHCRRPQRLGGRAKIHPSDRHRARARRLRHRLGTSPRYRYGVAHGSLGTRHRRRAGWRHRHRVSARECGVAARDRRARPPDQRALPASRHAARISRGATG